MVMNHFLVRIVKSYEHLLLVFKSARRGFLALGSRAKTVLGQRGEEVGTTSCKSFYHWGCAWVLFRAVSVQLMVL
jgi:hypothetical protein